MHLFTHKIRNSSIEKNEKRVLLSGTLQTMDTCCVRSEIILNSPGAMHPISPSKSSATTSASSVGEMDIHTPSKYAQCC